MLVIGNLCNVRSARKGTNRFCYDSCWDNFSDDIVIESSENQTYASYILYIDTHRNVNTVSQNCILPLIVSIVIHHIILTIILSFNFNGFKFVA